MQTLHFFVSALIVLADPISKLGGISDLIAAEEPRPEFPHIDFRSLKRVDILGIPFGDTVLNEFSTSRNIGPNNLSLQDDFVLRFAHLAETHARDLEALGLESCFHYTPTERQTNDFRSHQSGPDRIANLGSVGRVTKDFWRSRHCFLQRIRLPNGLKWRTARTPVSLREPRVISLFFPNAMPIYLDTTGTWPFGQRPSDPMPARFGALFLKMGDDPGDCSGRIDIEALRASKKKPSVGPNQADRCDIDVLARPSKGKVANAFKAWKSTFPALPHHPLVHRWKDAFGKTVEGFPEDTFPFLLPPNSGLGYYQTVNDRSDPYTVEIDRLDHEFMVNYGAKDWAVANYRKHDPFIGYHRYCEKNDGTWRASTTASQACNDEAKARFGSSGQAVQPSRVNETQQDWDAQHFYKICFAVVAGLCRGESPDSVFP